MTLLPIVERELRVAARKKATFGWRLGLSTGAFLLAMIIALGFDYLPYHRTGVMLFQCLSLITFIYGLAAGILHTADCLCSEKRDGTLGLLFLTELRGHDIALGKLAASSLPSMYGVLAVLPILALSFALGGVTLGEFGRISLVLLLSIGWSLALGLMVSAFLKEARSAVAMTCGLLLTLTALPYLIWWINGKPNYGTGWLSSWYGLLSPAVLYESAQDAYFQNAAGQPHFYTTAFGIAGAAVLALIAASWQVPRCWRDAEPNNAVMRWIEVGRSWLHWRGAKGRSDRRSLLECQPYAWLIQRDRWTLTLTWTTLALLLPFWLLSYMGLILTPGSRSLSSNFITLSICLVASFLMHLAVKNFLIMESVRQASADVQSGAMELLLVSPLPARDILDGQTKALWRGFRAPLAFLLGTNVLLFLGLVVMDRFHLNGEYRIVLGLILLGGTAMIFLDAMAIIPMGLWMGLQHGRPHKAAWLTRTAIIVPSYGILLVSVSIDYMMSLGGTGFTEVILPLYFLTGLMTCFMAKQQAVDGLNVHLRRIASGDTYENTFDPNDDGATPEPIRREETPT